MRTRFGKAGLRQLIAFATAHNQKLGLNWSITPKRRYVTIPKTSMNPGDSSYLVALRAAKDFYSNAPITKAIDFAITTYNAKLTKLGVADK